MTDDKTIKCMYFDHRFAEKPQGKQCGWVQKSLTQTDISIENLAGALVNGASFKPGVLIGGNKAANWKQQQLFGLDFDDGIRIEEAYNKVKTLGLTPCFMYTTFSHTEEHHKFRMIFCNDTVVADGNVRDKLQVTLMGVIGGVDEVCFNRDRLFFGGKGQVVLYPDYEARINAESIIDKYWNDDYEQYISNAKPKSKKKSTTAVSKSKDKSDTDKEELVFADNTDAISTLNVSLLRERLGIEGDLVGTDRRRYSLLVPTQSSDGDTDGVIDGVYQFQSEAEMYEYINSIDLQEYLGVPNDAFCCILQ